MGLQIYAIDFPGERKTTKKTIYKNISRKRKMYKLNFSQAECIRILLLLLLLYTLERMTDIINSSTLSTITEYQIAHASFQKEVDQHHCNDWQVLPSYNAQVPL